MAKKSKKDELPLPRLEFNNRSNRLVLRHRESECGLRCYRLYDGHALTYKDACSIAKALKMPLFVERVTLEKAK